MRTRAHLCPAVLVLSLTVLAAPAHAQSLDLTVKNVGISIGDSERIVGLRLNFRDRRMLSVYGINATLWQPHDPMLGTVNGLGLGLPVTGAIDKALLNSMGIKMEP